MKRKILFSFLPVTPQVRLHPIVLDLKCLSQNPCCLLEMFSNAFGIVPRAPTTPGTTFTISWYLCTFSFSFDATLLSLGTAVLIRWHISCLSETKSHRILTWSVSSTFSGTWSYHFNCTLTLYFLHKSQWITLANLSAFVLCLSMHSAFAALHNLHIGDLETSDFLILAFITFIRRDAADECDQNVIRPSVSFFSSLLNHSEVLLLLRYISGIGHEEVFPANLVCLLLFNSCTPLDLTHLPSCISATTFPRVLLIITLQSHSLNDNAAWYIK